MSFPEREAVGHTGHVRGDTYAEAAQQGAELLQNLIGLAGQDGSPMSAPQTFDADEPAAS